MNFIQRLSQDFAEPSVIIKHENTLIGKIPLVLLTMFDIYDCVKEFDNVITISHELISAKYVGIFVENIVKILSNQYVFDNNDECLHIVVLLEYLQYNNMKIFYSCLNKKIAHDLNFNVALKNKINKLACDESVLLDIIDRMIEFPNTVEDICILASAFCVINMNMIRTDNICSYILAKAEGDTQVRNNIDNFIKYVHDNHKYVFIGYKHLSDIYQNDWNNLNIKSPIAGLYSICLGSMQNNRCVFYDKNSSEMYIIHVNNNHGFQYNVDIHAYITNINTKCSYETYIFVGRFNSDFYVEIDKEYFTNEWYFVVDL